MFESQIFLERIGWTSFEVIGIFWEMIGHSSETTSLQSSLEKLPPFSMEMQQLS